MSDSPEHSAPQRPTLNDCWNKIGVQGDGSCPELVRHLHCRNCPVYAAAAEALLDRPLPADHLARWSAHFASLSPPSEAAWQSVLLFRLGAEWLALPTGVLDSVVTLRSVHSLPHRVDGVVRGITNVRGELLVCVSLALVLGTESAPERTPDRHAYERMLVLCRGASRFVAQVDEVHGMHRFPASRLLHPPETLARAGGRFTTMLLPWAERTVGCLDEARLFAALERSLA